VNWSSLRSTSVRWALLLIVGGAIGFGLSYFGRTTEPNGQGAPVVVTTTITPGGTPALEKTRSALAAAAETGDYEGLRPYIGDDFSYTFGGPVEGGPIAYWQELERTTGERPLDTLVAILQMPYTLSNGIYVWPWAYTVEDAAALSEHERELLAPLGSDDELFAGGTGYLGWRAGIRPDGTWAFFVAGD